MNGSKVSDQLILVGYATRDIAWSALQAGLSGVSIDYFGDLDQKALIHNISLMRDRQRNFTAENLVNEVMKCAPGIVIYGANLENYPSLIQRMSTKHRVCGNSSTVLKKARNLYYLNDLLENTEFHMPKIMTKSASEHMEGRWLLKHVESGGGIGIRFYQKDEPIKKGTYVQTFVEGKSLSATFLSNGICSRLLGISEQLIGSRRYGADGFKWSGNIFPWQAENSLCQKAVWKQVEKLAQILTEGCQLTGLNTIDFVLNSDGIHLLEINPRYSGSLPLLEAYLGINLLPYHINSCMGNKNEFSINVSPENNVVFMKVVIYAKKDIVIEDSTIFNALGAHDVPHPGDEIEKGSPLCTITRGGSSKEECTEKIRVALEILEQKLY